MSSGDVEQVIEFLQSYKPLSCPSYIHSTIVCARVLYPLNIISKLILGVKKKFQKRDYIDKFYCA